MKKILLIALYLLVMAAVGAGSQYALMAGMRNVNQTSAKSGPAAYGRLRELGQFRDYSTMREVESYTVSDTGTIEWFRFKAGNADIVKLAEAIQAKDPFTVDIVEGRAILPIHRTPARDGRAAWQYYVSATGAHTAGELTPPWWQPDTLAGSVCYLNRSNYAFAYYLIYDKASGEGYLIVRWG